MHNSTLHVIKQLLVFLLVLVLLLPVGIKLNHVFENHKHEVCTNHTKTHIHALDLDCEFYKFSLNTVYSINFQDIFFDFIKNNYKIAHSQYQFISNLQELSFLLRGPPQVV